MSAETNTQDPAVRARVANSRRRELRKLLLVAAHGVQRHSPVQPRGLSARRAASMDQRCCYCSRGDQSRHFLQRTFGRKTPATPSPRRRAPRRSSHEPTATRQFLALAATLAVSHFDPAIEHFFVSTTRVHVRVGRSLDGFFTRFNETTLTIAGIATYGIGRLVRSPTYRETRSTQRKPCSAPASPASSFEVRSADLVPPRPTTPTNTISIFSAAFRSSPIARFHRFIRPSGFAVATAIVQETRFHPRALDRRAGGVRLRHAGLSALPGQHWASDILAGAFMGTLASVKAVDYSHAHPNNWMDRNLIPKAAIRLTF